MADISNRILLVDDEEDILEFISYNLIKEGFTVKTASNGREAVKLAKSFDPELILLDVMMPGMDGPTWVKQALEKRPETKVVFVSGYAENAFTGGKPNVPNSVFLPKPFSLLQLTNTVGRQLQ